jgi:hypothetical protein
MSSIGRGEPIVIGRVVVCPSGFVKVIVYVPQGTPVVFKSSARDQ